VTGWLSVPWSHPIYFSPNPAAGWGASRALTAL